MKVLLFSNDLMPFGNLPTSGGGLRAWQLMKGLESHGIEVRASMPAFTFLVEQNIDKIPTEQKELLWNWETQQTILEREKPDAVLYTSNWDHFGLKDSPDVPLIIDLHGSRLIETTIWNCPINTEQKLNVLAKADCLLSAGLKQRLYFYGWLLQAGRVPENTHFIKYVPISLSPELPIHSTSSDRSLFPHFVSGGGWFPWQNQARAIFAICSEINRNGSGQIDIFGTPHELNTKSAEEVKIKEIYTQVSELSKKDPRVKVNGYVGRDSLLEIYRTADVAVELMEYNLERELAFTTRTIEYLWCGLPVIYNDYSEISEHIKEYDAGWAINPESDADIKRTLEEIFSNQKLIEQKSLNAQRLVKDRFTWDKTIEPLVDFLRNPTKAAKVTPAHGSVFARPSFLIPKGQTVNIEITSENSPLIQKFIAPSDDLSQIGIPLMVGEELHPSIAALECELKTVAGRVIGSLTIPVAEVRSKTFMLKLPRIFTPKGGECLQMKFSLKYLAATGELQQGAIHSGICLQCLVSANFPYLTAGSSALISYDRNSKKVCAQAVAISFHQGESKIYRAKTVIKRSIAMIRKGEWKRLYRACAKRLPQVAQNFLVNYVK